MAKRLEKKTNTNSRKSLLTNDTLPDRDPELTNITSILEENYMPYAMSVIVSRAIPEIDGFKPSHRKLLYTMYKMGLLTGNRTKSANVVGQTMKLNPHGDQAIYDTLVRLTRGNGALLHPYIDSKGNFGKQYSRDMQHAAPRYTEVRLEKICEELFKGIDKNSVPLVDNYDGTMLEPKLLPCTFPTVLVNSNQGIAVGMASNISSFNLKEVCDATISYIKDDGQDILDIMPAPDFSGGGQILYDKEQMRNIYETGKGPVLIRSKYEIDKKNNLIEITEIPYSTSSEAIIDDIAQLVKSGKIREINDIRDETDLDGLKITIDCKRGTNHEELMTKLFRFTKLEDTFSCNFNLLINGNPRVLGIKAIIGEWVEWRKGCIRNECEFDLSKKNDRLHLLEGLEKILLDIDKAIKIIRNTELEEDVIPNLMKGFDIDKVQAEYVAEIKLRNINKQYIINRISDKTKLISEIEDLIDILAKPKRIDNLIIKTLKEVSEKYAVPRKSELIIKNDVSSYVPTTDIPEYQVHLMLTREGYFKKITSNVLKKADEIKTKDDDEIIIDIEADNKSEVLFFSSFANVYKVKTYDYVDMKANELGLYLTNELELEPDEKILYMLSVTDYKGNLMIGFENGKIALFPVSAYETKKNRKKLINAFYGDSEAKSFIFIPEGENLDIWATKDDNKGIVFNSSLIPLKTTKTTMGVQVLETKKGSKLDALKLCAEVNLDNPEYYRARKIPSKGYFIKEKSLEGRQIGLFDF